MVDGKTPSPGWPTLTSINHQLHRLPMPSFPFERLEVWQQSRSLVIEVYRMTQAFPKQEQFGLTSQVQRAAVSVAANLAEGTSRTSAKDQAHFSQLAFGSLMELACLIQLARDLDRVSSSVAEALLASIALLAPRISKLRDSQLRRSVLGKAE
jgi:four helix bundle protein